MERTADIAVVGLGAMGSAALWRLASRGASVVGFERFDPGHSLGSSHGATRIFRTAYFEDAQYVPLLLAALEWWRRLELESARELLSQIGGLMIGRPESALISGALRSVHEHRLPHRVLERAAMAAHYPQHKLAVGDVAILDELAGVLFPEESIAAATGLARDRGASVHSKTAVERIEPDPAYVDIVVGSQRLRVRHAVVCAGPWVEDLISVPGCQFAIERQVMTWFKGSARDLFTPSRFPVFVRELADGSIGFGIPDMGDGLIKVGIHHGAGEIVRPDSMDRSVRQRDYAMTEGYVASTIDGLVPSVAKATVCLYTNSPDEHFVVGPLPGVPNVTVVSPCSGHGFKFAPLIGEIAADLALHGGTEYVIDMFAPSRFAS
ncbi:MAG TPA: N-methyl-L-tryptophan oxidase [Candidatus Dormibacteraeota bacterium]|nr:N-methyl-L-tryptophan oxidase [Candidatus Dormibacteraeota bacterium]